MLKELHIAVKGNTRHWDRPCVDSWQPIEQGCYNVCKNCWPGLKVELPDAKELQKHLDLVNKERRMSWVNLQQNKAASTS